MKGYKPDLDNKELASKSMYLELGVKGVKQHNEDCECDDCKKNK